MGSHRVKAQPMAASVATQGRSIPAPMRAGERIRVRERMRGRMRASTLEREEMLEPTLGSSSQAVLGSVPRG